MMDVDTLEIQVLGQLYSLDDSVLSRVCDSVAVSETGKSKRQVLKEVRAVIVKISDGQNEDEIRRFLEDLQAVMNPATEDLDETQIPPLEETDDDEANDGDTKSTKKKPVEKLLKMQKDLQSKVNELSKKVKTAQAGSRDSIKVDGVGANVLYRRELKISGTIGSPGETNKLNFISLIHQIEGALSKGYTEAEVRDAVIRAISPGMTLRSFLECTPDLALSKLRKILRSHYREKSSTELYKSLSTLAQYQSEDAQSFLFRALELRQRIVFTSKEADSKIKYDPTMIQSLFLHSVETGLRDEAIRSKLRPYLQNPGVQDEELISEMNTISLEEQERQAKFGKKPSKIVTGRVENLTLLKHTPLENREQTSNHPSGNEQFLAALNSLKAGLSELQVTVNELKSKPVREAQKEAKPPSQKPRGCDVCQKSGKTEECDHCFICGDSSHFAWGCRKRNSQKNGRGLRSRRGQP